MKKHYNIPIFIPELACPFQCVFCNQQKITGKKNIPSENDITRIIDSHLLTIDKKESIIHVAFFGGSFTGIPLNLQEKYLGLVQPYLQSGQISGIRLSTRPDYIDEQALEFLKGMHVNAIELGAQSMDDDVLANSKRGHSSEQTRIAAEQIKDFGFELGLQMMIGLPGDLLEKSLDTANEIIKLKAANTRIYPALVIKDTALHKWYLEDRYKPLAIDEAIEWTKRLILLFEKTNVDILRIGLHPSEGLLSGDELIAGPFHVSFKELVMTEIWSDLLLHQIKGMQCDSIEIRVPEKELNFAIGYKARNKKALLKHYSKVKFVGDAEIIERSNFQVH